MAHIKRITLKSGKTRYEASYRDPTGRERQRTFARKVDADKFLTSIEAAKVRGEWVDPRLSRITLGEFSTRWLATIRDRELKTQMGYESLLRRHVLPAFGDYPLGRIDTLRIREWVAQMSAAGLSRDSVRQAKQVLSAILTLAVEANYIVRNPCQGIRLGKGAKQEKCFLTDAQVVALARVIAPPYSTLVYFLAYSGLRWGEAAALRRRRCDLAHSRVEVAEALSEARGLHFKPTKTAETRVVVIPELVRDLLAEHLARHVEEHPDALVFTAPEGTLLRNSNFHRRVWKPALRAAGLPSRMRIHDMRHTCAALLIRQYGANPKQIQRHLGHSSITVSMDTYGHLFPEDMERLAEGLNAGLANALRQAADFSRTSRDEAEVELPTLGTQTLVSARS